MVEACCPSGFGWEDSDRPSTEACCSSGSSVEEVECDRDGLRTWNLRNLLICTAAVIEEKGHCLRFKLVDSLLVFISCKALTADCQFRL